MGRARDQTRHAHGGDDARPTSGRETASSHSRDRRTGGAQANLDQAEEGVMAKKKNKKGKKGKNGKKTESPKSAPDTGEVVA